LAKKKDDMQILRMARDAGLITESELDTVMTEHRHTGEHRTTQTPLRLAISKGYLNEEATHDLETQAWLKQLPPQCGHYRLERLIGRGGMAVVFEAHDLSLGKRVAVKILLPEFSTSDTYLARFHREARIAAKLTHPHTVQVFAAGEQDGMQYLVMEYVEGETLSDVIRARGSIPEAEALDITRQLAGALEEAGGHGIVHRDIKPSNILMSKWGIPKLADFGIAKEFRDIPDAAIQMSLTMGVVGTPTYMSPEQARGARDIDLRSDIYGLGATLYHTIIGSVPFGADTPQETMVRVVSEAPRPPLSINPDLSEEAGAVICRMMAKDPDDRYQTYEELSEDLEAAMNGDEVSTDYDEAVQMLRPRRQDDDEDDSDYVRTKRPRRRPRQGEEEESDPMRIAMIAVGVAILGLLAIIILKGC
jgi:eukaryotic-like serine/threonine-protein kinase